MITIDDSYVKHLNNKGVKYVEGYDNHFVGVLNEQNNKFYAKFTNSFGKDSSVNGEWRKLGFIYLLWGKAYGYNEYPDGLFYAGVGFRFRNTIRMLMPGVGKGFNRTWLKINANIKEYKDG